MIRPNWLDRAIGSVAPGAALRRIQARAAFASLEAFGGGYDGAKAGPQLRYWRPGGGDAGADLLPDLTQLRERSRDLERNSPLAAGAISTYATSVVGTGLVCRPKVDAQFLGLTDDQADAWETAAERIFCTWAEGPNSDYAGWHRFAVQQDVALRSVLVNGDAFGLKRFVPDRPIGFALQLVEADRVSTPNGKRDGADGIFGGIQLDETGRRVTCHIATKHPGALDRGSAKWTPVPFEVDGRRVVLHLFRPRRIGQPRGVPILAPVIESLKQLSRYTDAELTAAVVSGMLTVFIKSGSQTTNPLAGAATAGPTGAPELKLGNGAILDLGPGEEVETVDPNRPNQGFDPFVQAILRQVGVAIEVPFEVLIKHFTASYSAARAALLEAWRAFASWRGWLAAELCQPCYEEVITEAVARGLLTAPGFFADPYLRAAYLQADWIGPAPGQIDPLKEAEAAEKMIELGAKTREQVTVELTGGDWRRNHRQLARETKLRAADGLNVPVVPAAPRAVPAPVDQGVEP